MRRRMGLTAMALLLAASGAQGWAQCGQASITITNLPEIPLSGFQVYGLNATGQLTGFYYVALDHAPHAFLWDQGALTDLGTFGGDTSSGNAINSAGQIAGQSDLTNNTATHAFLYSGGTPLDLGTLGGTFSSASSINEAGLVAGSSLSADGSTVAFLYTNGGLVSLGTLGGSYSVAMALNNAGMVAGESATLTGDTHGYVYAGAGMTDVGTLGGSYSTIYALNDAGMAVGLSSLSDGSMHGFTYSGGTLTDIGTLGGTFSVAFGVNTAGQVIGDAVTSDGQFHGFIYSAGAMTDLGTLGGDYSYADGMNNLGQVVGESATTDEVSHAFLWQDGKLVDLNTLLPPDAGWLLNSGQYINDSGRIVGVGVKDGLSQWFIMDLRTGNNPPVAVVGPDQHVDCTTQAILDGSASSDPDHDPLTYQWSLQGVVLGSSAVLAEYLPLGTNVVTLTVSDPCNATSQTNVTVVVSDTVAPTVAGPAPLTIAADGHCQAVVPNVLPQVVATDNCTPANELVLSQNPAAGTIVGSGQYTIVVSATDEAGNTGTTSVGLSVVDTTPPVIQSLTVSPDVLSPPNHALIPVTVTVTAQDNCDPAPVSQILSITADGPTAPGEIQITGKLSATLAASKNTSGTARIYTITVSCTDAAGNSSLGTAYVSVPNSNGNGNSNPNKMRPH